MSGAKELLAQQLWSLQLGSAFPKCGSACSRCLWGDEHEPKQFFLLNTSLHSVLPETGSGLPPNSPSLVLQSDRLLFQPTSQTMEETRSWSQVLAMLGICLKLDVEISSQASLSSGTVTFLQLSICLSQRTSLPSVTHDSLA